jgi:hypothetical protein
MQINSRVEKIPFPNGSYTNGMTRIQTEEERRASLIRKIAKACVVLQVPYVECCTLVQELCMLNSTPEAATREIVSQQYQEDDDV